MPGKNGLPRSNLVTLFGDSLGIHWHPIQEFCATIFLTTFIVSREVVVHMLIHVCNLILLPFLEDIGTYKNLLKIHNL